MAVNPIPADYPGVTPHLYCRDAVSLIEFYKTAFGATEIYRLLMPDGRIGHAELTLCGGRVMLADEFPEWGCVSPLAVGGSGMSLMGYVADVDAFADQAIAAGAKVLMPVADQFYGDRSCKLQDPSGHVWMFATRIEEVPIEEMQRRCDVMCANDP
jgi:PhnB protein